MRPVDPLRNHGLGGAAILAVTLIVGACTAAAPGWTFAPPPASSAPSAGPSGDLPGTSPAASGAASGSPVPSAAASPAASVGTSAAPSTGASPAASTGASPAGSGATGGVVLNVKAENIAFDVSSLTAAANTPFQIKFENDDQGTQHDVAIKDGSGALKWQGDLVTGVAETTYQVPALPAGSYTFVCVVHPSMTGTLDIH